MKSAILIALLLVVCFENSFSQNIVGGAANAQWHRGGNFVAGVVPLSSVLGTLYAAPLFIHTGAVVGLGLFNTRMTILDGGVGIGTGFIGIGNGFLFPTSPLSSNIIQFGDGGNTNTFARMHS